MRAFVTRGIVKSGDYKGCNLYYYGKEKGYVLVNHSDLPYDDKSSINYFEGWFDKRMLKGMAFDNLDLALQFVVKHAKCWLTPETVERYEIISEDKSVSPGEMFLRGSLIAGPVLGAALAKEAENDLEASVAVYMNNGKKFVLYFEEAGKYLGHFKEVLFKL